MIFIFIANTHDSFSRQAENDLDADLHISARRNIVFMTSLFHKCTSNKINAKKRTFKHFYIQHRDFIVHLNYKSCVCHSCVNRGKYQLLNRKTVVMSTITYFVNFLLLENQI